MTRGSRLPFALLALALAELAGAGAFGVVSAAWVPQAGHNPASGVFLISACLGFAVIGAVVARRQPQNRVAWMMLGIGICVPLGISNQYVLDSHYAPARFPMPWLAGLIGNAGWFLALAMLLSCFLYFPNGRLLSPRWRWPARFAVIAVVLGLLGESLDPHGLDNGPAKIHNPIGIAGASDVMQVLFLVAMATLVGVGVSGLVSLVLRYRSGPDDARQQLKYVLLAIGFLVLTFAFTFTQPISSIPDWVVNVVYGLGYLSIPVAVGLAILRYRLYDIDLVISRALVYGSLAVFITGVYVGIVVGLGSLLGSAAQPNLGLSIVATAVVAVAFQPLRERLTKIANRLVFGRRSSPYQVLAEFTRQVTGEEALQRMAEVLAAGTGSAQAAVYIGERRVAAYPSDPNGTAMAEPRSVEVWHQGRRLGRLEVRKRRGEFLTPLEEKLLDDLANQAGLVFSNVGLAADLRLRLDELRASRQRLVQAQDSERRRLERNLHDGAQQHLVALKVRLGLAAAVAAKEPGRLPQLLADLQFEADTTLATMRSLAHGIYPPLLAERGLKEALESDARRATLPVAVDAAELARYPQEVEAAVYFCCLEALQNVQKYSHAGGATVRLSEEDGVLSFEVADDGVGFDPHESALGAGLTNIRDRVDALGGELEISSMPGQGTKVRGRIAVRVLA
ncbi:MAG TPA: histidine kinase [Candidatus Dormibacteraeota bacterium]